MQRWYIRLNPCIIDGDVITTWLITGFGKVCAPGVWERLLALSGTSYKWLSQHGVHPSLGVHHSFANGDKFCSRYLGFILAATCLCHGMTSLPLLHPPLAASDPIHLHSTPTPKHTCTTYATMSCPLLD